MSGQKQSTPPKKPSSVTSPLKKIHDAMDDYQTTLLRRDSSFADLANVRRKLVRSIRTLMAGPSVTPEELDEAFESVFGLSQ